MQPRNASHFTSDRIANSKLTKEKISADIAAFQSSGGQIEKLGNTPTRKAALIAEAAAAQAELAKQ
ncbi:MAG TPA: hypothetical protein VIP30_00460 [Stenotrophomonas sp.]